MLLLVDPIAERSPASGAVSYTHLLAVCLGVCKGCAGDASGARLGGYLKIHGKHARNFHTAAAQDVFSLSVFPIEPPVDALCRNGNRSDVGLSLIHI